MTIRLHMADTYHQKPTEKTRKQKTRGAFHTSWNLKSSSNGIEYTTKNIKNWWHLIFFFSFHVLNIFFVNFSDPMYIKGRQKKKKLPTFIHRCIIWFVMRHCTMRTKTHREPNCKLYRYFVGTREPQHNIIQLLLGIFERTSTIP